MRNIFIVIQKEVLLRLKSKTFVLMTLLGPLLIFLFGYLVKILDTENKREHNIVVYDETKLVYKSLTKTEGVNYYFVKKTDLEGIKKYILNKKWDGLLYVPSPKSGNMSAIETNIMFYYNSSPSVSIIERIKKDLNDRIRKIKLQKYGIPLEKVYNAETDVIVKLISFNNEKNSILLWKVKSIIGGGLGILTYLFIFIYGAMIMRNILHEKTSRVVEIVLSSVKSFHLMLGKIISNAIVGIIQFFIWGLGSSLLFFFIKKSIGIVPVSTQLPSQSQSAKYAVNTVNDAFLKNIFEIMDMVDFSIIFSVGTVMFVLGYLFYSSIFAVIGAIVNSESETSQFTLPITLPLVLSIYLGVSILENPNGTVAFWMSMVPFTSPVVLMARIPFGIPYWQVILSISILFITLLCTVWFSGKLYRKGIVNYQKTLLLIDIFKTKK